MTPAIAHAAVPFARHPDMDAFPCSAQLREMTAVDAANALRPAYGIIVGAAVALLIAAATLTWIALAQADHCLALAARV